MKIIYPILHEERVGLGLLEFNIWFTFLYTSNYIKNDYLFPPRRVFLFLRERFFLDLLEEGLFDAPLLYVDAAFFNASPYVHLFAFAYCLTCFIQSEAIIYNTKILFLNQIFNEFHLFEYIHTPLELIVLR
jgi:hypothetical protein